MTGSADNDSPLIRLGYLSFHTWTFLKSHHTVSKLNTSLSLFRHLNCSLSPSSHYLSERERLRLWQGDQRKDYETWVSFLFSCRLLQSTDFPMVRRSVDEIGLKCWIKTAVPTRLSMSFNFLFFGAAKKSFFHFLCSTGEIQSVVCFESLADFHE